MSQSQRALRKLVPIAPLPTLTGGTKAHFQLMTLQMLVVREYRLGARGVKRAKGIVLDDERWRDLCTQAGVAKGQHSFVREGWQDDAEGAAEPRMFGVGRALLG